MISDNTQLEFRPKDFPILFKDNYRARKLGDQITEIQKHYFEEYNKLKCQAPKRDNYWVDTHNGIITTEPGTNKKSGNSPTERHLEIALWNSKKNLGWSSPEAGEFRLLDYQFPLYSDQKKQGIGEVDLIGVTDRGRITVIELKVMDEKGKPNGNPLGALIQGLRYSAIIQNKDNWKLIRKEASAKAKGEIINQEPIIQLMAPELWWNHWLKPTSRRETQMGEWKKSFVILIKDIKVKLELEIEFLALPKNILKDIKDHKNKPNLSVIPHLNPVFID